MKNARIKKVLATSAAGLCLLTGMTPVNAASTTVSVKNSVISAGVCTFQAPYPSDIRLARKLADVYEGNVCLFSNTSKRFPVGSSLNNNTTYYVNKKWSGRQCYIYANAVYYYMFGDYVGHGDGNYKYSKVALKNQATASYSSFKKAGVVSGSYLRTTSNKNGTYNGNSGHSLIILSYDANQIITLEGNANGSGSIEIKTRTWSEFNNSLLKNKGRRICHVVVPLNYCPI